MLCPWLSQHYGLPMITEVARAVLAELEADFDQLRTDMDLVADRVRRVFARQVEVERAWFRSTRRTATATATESRRGPAVPR